MVRPHALPAHRRRGDGAAHGLLRRARRLLLRALPGGRLRRQFRECPVRGSGVTGVRGTPPAPVRGCAGSPRAAPGRSVRADPQSPGGAPEGERRGGRRTGPCPGGRDAVMEGGGAGGWGDPPTICKMESAASGGRPRGQGCGQGHPTPPFPITRPGVAAGSGRAGMSGANPAVCPAPRGGCSCRSLPAAPPSSRGAGDGARQDWQGCHGKWRMGRNKMESG